MTVQLDPRYLAVLARPDCDRVWVRAGVEESLAQIETRISQINAEIRSEYRPPTLEEQEELASLQLAIETEIAILAFLDDLELEEA